MRTIKRILPSEGWKAVCTSSSGTGDASDSAPMLPLLCWAEMDNGDLTGLIRDGNSLSRADEMPDFLGYTL